MTKLIGYRTADLCNVVSSCEIINTNRRRFLITHSLQLIMSPNSKEYKNLQSSKTHKQTSIQSSFPGLVYSGPRGVPFPNIFDWLEVKRRDDNIGDLWRVHDKLYNLETFIDKHPGGKDWIEFSKGTDITEAFESAHIVGVKQIEQLLSKYFVKNANAPRNSPYTFKEDGFYRTLKKRVEPTLKKVGTDSSAKALLIQDSLAIAYIIIALFSVWTESIFLQIIAGLVLGMCIVGAHNFFHKKDNWRRFYFDLSPLSSYEWRISHAYSHHLYPNSILDFEVLLGEPLVEMLPIRPKNFVQKYIAVMYADLLYLLYGPSQIIVRALSIYKGKQKLRPENFIILVELLLFLTVSPTYRAGFSAWMIIFMGASFWFIFVSNNSAHHHMSCFHDGDEARKDSDFGLCQLDATFGKSDWYHKSLFSVMTTFGQHPLHHLFPTICHSKLEYLKPALQQTLKEFSEEFPEFTQLQLFIGTHKQMGRTKRNALSNISR